MGIFDAARKLMTVRVVEFDAADAPEPGTNVTPPSRANYVQNVTPDTALTLSSVYRGVQIHGTAASQLRLGVWNDSTQLPTPLAVQKPDQATSRSAFFEYIVNCLALTGNAYWMVTRSPSNGLTINRQPLVPSEVIPLEDPRTGALTFSYRGTEYTDKQIRHLKLMRVPGQLRGLGPIQAARVELRGAISARDYGALWLDEANVPDGILTTDQALAGDQAKSYKNVWYGRNADGSKREGQGEGNPRERLRVVGNGLHYEHLMLKPSDIQFLETQQFTTTQIARLLAVPSSLMLAAVEGTAQTYSNIEQDWIGYIRFGLMRYLREIEEAIALDLPAGQEARFNIDALLRTDTKTRYEAHNLALTGGWQTDDEIRALEGKAPLTPAQRAQIAARKSTPAPSQESAA
jgi:HK97 family phage portal protein